MAAKLRCIKYLCDKYDKDRSRRTQEGTASVERQHAQREAASRTFGTSHPSVKLWKTEMSYRDQLQGSASGNEEHPGPACVTPEHSEDTLKQRPSDALRSQRAAGQPPPEFELHLWMQQLQRDAEAEVRRIMTLYPEDFQCELSAGLLLGSFWFVACLVGFLFLVTNLYLRHRQTECVSACGK